jgi:hypothetical protein
MLLEEHERLLDLIVEYYNCREKWLENNTRNAGIAYRKVLKELHSHTKHMMKGVQEIQHVKRAENIKTFQEQGFVPRKSKPKSRR